MSDSKTITFNLSDREAQTLLLLVSASQDLVPHNAPRVREFAEDLQRQYDAQLLPFEEHSDPWVRNDHGAIVGLREDLSLSN